MLLVDRARAWLYGGRWVAECPRDCGQVEPLFDDAGRRRAEFACGYCGLVAPIEWARDEADIMTVLERRPIPHTRNWFPAGHQLAVRAGLPHGQTIADLLTENHDHGVV